MTVGQPNAARLGIGQSWGGMGRWWASSGGLWVVVVALGVDRCCLGPLMLSLALEKEPLLHCADQDSDGWSRFRRLLHLCASCYRIVSGSLCLSFMT